MGEPFRDYIRKLNREGKTFIDMQVESSEARSFSWWNTLVNYGQKIPPTDEDHLADIATMMRLPVRTVCEMVAEEWYGVKPGDGMSKRALRLAPDLDRLSEADVELVASLVRRLALGSAGQ